jgi:CHAT domain-containing protein
MQKISLLILLFVFSLSHPVKENKNFDLNNNSAVNDLDSLKTQVKLIPPSFQKTFLYSLILKRELKFTEMFDSLFSLLGNSPDNFRYYDELSFASIATNRQLLLQTYFEKNKSFKAEYRCYLFGLFNLINTNSKSALAYFIEALKSDSLNPHILYQISFAYRDLGDYPKALNALKKSLEYNLNDKYLNAENLLAQGSIFFLSGETDKAEKYYNDALQTSSSLNDLHVKSRAIVNLGIIKDIKGNSGEARNYFFEAQKIAAEINDIDNQALAYSELGVSFSFTNNLIEAKKNYLKSYEMYSILGNRGRLSLLSDNIAKIYMTMFDYTSALNYYNKGIQFAGDNKRAHILNLIGLADVYNNISNYTKAIEYYKEAQILSSQINELSLKAEVNKGLGILNYNLDKYENALHYFNSFEELTKKSEDVYMVADAYHKIGICLMQIDSLKKSGEYLLKAEVNAQKAGDDYLAALCFTDLAMLNIKMNDISKAADFLTKARTIVSKGNFDYLNVLIELITGDISKDFINSKSHYESALSFAKKINDYDLQIEAYALLAKLFEKNNLSEVAASYYNSAINLVEDISRPLFKTDEIQISYISSKHDVYSSYADLLLKHKDYKKAFYLIDKSRSRNLMQNLTNLKLHSLIKDEKTLNRLYEYEWMMHSGLYIKSQMDSISLQYNLFKKDLISSDKTLSEYIGTKTTISVDQMQNKLKNGENILSIYSSVDNTYLFLINKNEFKAFVTGVPKREVKKMLSFISPYYDREADSPTSFYNQDLFSFNAAASNKLYEKLLKVALNEIPKQEKIIIIPSFELLVLPFDFLVSNLNKESSSYSYGDKHYLIYDYDFSYSTSASAFTFEKVNHPTDYNESLIVGDPSIDSHINGFAERRGLLDDYPGIKRNLALLPLKYSKEEVSEIADILNSGKILTAKNATETNFKRSVELKSIIHLSTHSFLINKQPVIFFSNVYDPENDGFLEASEIVQLKLNSDLVVLSSCSSGLGRVDESEGIIGMSKAFFEAGTKSIIVSLWEVNDKYTSRLMTLFYSKLSGGLDKSEALRQAKIEFIKKYSPNPYYWGAFVLSGDISLLPIKHHLNINYLFVGVVTLTLIILVLIIRKFKKVQNI